MNAIARAVFAAGALFLGTAIAQVPAWAGATPGGEAAVPLSAGSTEAPAGIPRIEARGFFGLLPGGEIDALAFDGLRLEVGQRLPMFIFGKPAMYVTDVAAHVQLLGSAHHGLWLRAGYQYHVVSYTCRNDRSHILDVGAEFRGRSQGGHLLQIELGPETLRREGGHYVCQDSGVPGSGFGARFSALGQLALGQHVGLFARVGLRTAPHLLEIRFLPQADVGIAVVF